MTGPTSYRIELRGRLSDHILAPYSPEFAISRTTNSTVLIGDIRDPAHLHGIVTHLTSLGLELLSASTNDSPEP
ncbi:MAG: hypothetical protein ACR2QK_22520 [Acidimicrobiales bacterium]